LSEGEHIDLAVIGGSGFYEFAGLDDVEDHFVDTPYGRPSSAIRVGWLGQTRMAFLARHAVGHRLLPGEVPQQANIWALKSLGAQRVIGVSAVGGLQEACAPGTAVVPDQLIDRTRGQRPSTFFGGGVVGHVAMAEPFCPALRAATVRAVAATGWEPVDGGSYVVIEGPAFGTRAESHLYRGWGASVVGMTALPEAKLAREAELCYTLLTTVTDYDSWHPTEAEVDAQTVFRVLEANVGKARAAVRQLAAMLPQASECHCHRALDAALVTPLKAIPEDARVRLAPLLRRRLEAER
jgi:5'-methylthioadenosine phosphorylase